MCNLAKVNIQVELLKKLKIEKDLKVKVSFLHPSGKPARRKPVARLKNLTLQAGAVDEIEANIRLSVFNK